MMGAILSPGLLLCYQVKCNIMLHRQYREKLYINFWRLPGLKL